MEIAQKVPIRKSEVPSTAESAQTHMAMQPVLQSTIAMGHTQQAAALLYQ